MSRVAILKPERHPSTTRLVGYLVSALERIGVTAQAFADSDAIPGFEPDFVLALDASAPKLTPHPTYGFLQDGWLAYQSPRILRNVLGYDAYLTASSRVREWIEDISFGARKRSPVELLAPSPPGSRLDIRRASPRTELAWLPGEHAATDIVERLWSRPYFRPAATAAEWLERGLPGHGVGLCLERGEAVADGQPSLHLFETVAAGAVAITTRSEFVTRWFGDSVLCVDGAAPADVAAWQIDRHMAWIRAHPEKASELAARAHAIFRTHFALERGLARVFALHRRVLDEKYEAPTDGSATSHAVAYVVRTDGDAERTLESLRAQTYPDVSVTLVPRSAGIDLAPLAARYADLRPTVLSAPPGPDSASLWAGLRAVRDGGATLFGMLDDRDELFPNHVTTVVRTLEHLDQRSWFGTSGVAYSATAERARERFQGDRLASREDRPARPTKRRLRHFRFYHPGYLDEGAHEVHPGSLLARTSLLDEELLADPGLETGCESYLELLLAEKTLFGFSCEVTAITHDRVDDDEEGREVAPLDDARRRAFFRTYGRLFPTASVYRHDVIYLTTFSQDLLAPIILPDATRDADRGTDLVPSALDEPPGVRLEGVDLAPGRYRLRCYFHADTAEVPFSVAFDYGGGDIETAGTLVREEPVIDARMAEFEIDTTLRPAALPSAICLVGQRASSALLGVRCDRRTRVVECSVFDLPSDRDVWVYGAGEGGTRAKRKLDLLGITVAGFVDKFKTGTVEGVPIIDLASAATRLGPDTTLIIASMFVQEIRSDVEAAGITAHLYSAYPFKGDVVFALN